MLIELIIDLLFLPLSLLIELLPETLYQQVPIINIPDIARMGAYFFPMDVLILAISGFTTWYAIHFAWAIIEWLYKKIPGIN